MNTNLQLVRRRIGLYFGFIRPRADEVARNTPTPTNIVVEAVIAAVISGVLWAVFTETSSGVSFGVAIGLFTAAFGFLRRFRAEQRLSGNPGAGAPR
ncbi:hypothetical protein DSM112329_03569 [Paraconexibacter sp. AEG42_29]|uniref:Uncharacterized protein n=1 Tax=Paraconexibacter sp. AEG42_29 TaxID=2997339 RepID=A0AAU7AYI9_9ACTN